MYVSEMRAFEILDIVERATKDVSLFKAERWLKYVREALGLFQFYSNELDWFSLNKDFESFHAACSDFLEWSLDGDSVNLVLVYYIEYAMSLIFHYVLELADFQRIRIPLSDLRSARGHVSATRMVMEWEWLDRMGEAGGELRGQVRGSCLLSVLTHGSISLSIGE